MVSIEDHLATWDGELCALRSDRETGAFFVIAIHSRRRGPSGGGTRAMTYESPLEAVVDATRLAESMSMKNAMADLPMGGGKSTIALPAPRHALDPSTWRRILEIHAENVAAFNGNYIAAPDIGTSAADMDVVHAACGFAAGRTEAAGGSGSSAPPTARGVFVALTCSAAEAGIGDVEGRTVCVQGLGAVGLDVARLALEAGAHVVGADVVPSAREAASRLGVRIVDPEKILDVESDVFVPCATGGVIDHEVATRLPTQVVVGAANNVLSDARAGRELHRRGILFAPDFVANAGGAIHLAGRNILGWSADEVERHVLGIADTLGVVYERSRERGCPPAEAAQEIGRQRLTSWTGGSTPLARLP